MTYAINFSGKTKWVSFYGHWLAIFTWKKKRDQDKKTDRGAANERTRQRLSDGGLDIGHVQGPLQVKKNMGV